jgi:putative transferase (TIGR04331 family)
MNQINKEQVFLATTALEEFWDTTKPIVFLGDWCLRYSRRRVWEPLAGQVMPAPWSSKQESHGTVKYLGGVYDRLLPLLSRSLNDIHRENHTERYWRIIIGPWLLHYIDVIFERYVSLSRAIDNHPDFTTLGLTKDCFVIPRDADDHDTWIPDDAYNLQLYTRILDALGIKFPRKPFSLNDHLYSYHHSNNKENPKKFIKKIARNFLSYIYSLRKKQRLIFLSKCYFPTTVELKLFLMNYRNVSPYYREKIDLPFMPINYDVRTKLGNISMGKSEFETLLVKTLPLDMPQSFIESYRNVENDVKNNYPPNPRAIMSAVLWYFHGSFRHWAASTSERGTKLIGVQHGGNYGSDLHLKIIDHEFAISDCYYTWGWTESMNLAQTIPMPATKLMAIRPMKNKNRNDSILMLTTGLPRYFRRFGNLNNYEYGEYLNQQLNFMSSLFPEIRTKVRIRLYQYDFGWDLVERWENVYPSVNIETWNIPFLNSLENCELFVSDHLSTTFVEALSAGKPTILFWSPQIFMLRPDAEPYYKELRDVGILHDTPESAAEVINTVYSDLRGWWTDSRRQTALKKFCVRFARMSPKALDDWSCEFQRIAKEMANNKAH